MTLEMLVSSALMGYTMEEQTKILKAIETGSALTTRRLNEGLDKVIEIFDSWEPVVEGYAGFPIERDSIQKKKQQFKDDRNIGRVVQAGGNSYVVTGRKSDGRYIVVGKGGEKTAKDPADMGLQVKEHIDIEDLHQMMIEKKMDGVDDNGFTSCWKGYKKRGTKMKGGKEVNNCVKEDAIDEALSGERYKEALKKGKMYSRKVSADPEKRATRGGRGGESDFGAGDRGAGNKAARRAGTYSEEYVDEATAMAKRGYDEAPIRNKIAKSTGGGKAADRASALEDRPTYGDANKAKQRSNYARKQRGDFRNTTSSSPGLHGYAHKSDDPKVKAKQAARGAQRGALTPNEKKQLNREQTEFLNRLSDSGLFTEAEIERIMEGME